MPDPQIDLKDYRQPLVTSLGVILGFLLGFLGQWVTEDTFALTSVSDFVTLFGSTIGAVLLLVTLFRMLSPNGPPDRAFAFYRLTLRLYVAGVVVPLLSILFAALL